MELVNNPGTTSLPAVASVAIRVPPFWEKSPATWFRQLESQFVLSEITRDSTKYHYVSANLENKYTDVVMDIINNPPATDMYETLKAELIRRLSDAKEQNIRHLLEHEEIGDRKPSIFLRRLQNLAGDTVSDDFLKTLWLGRLPTNVQAILITRQKETFSELAALAEAVVKVSPRPQIAAALSAHNELLEEIAKLRREVAALRMGTNNFCRSRSKSQSGRRGSSRSRNRDEENIATDGKCWYHRKHGTAAKKCRDPCTFAAGNSRADRKWGLAIPSPRRAAYLLRTASPGQCLWSIRDPTCRFVVADVTTPIIGADFLSFYGLLVDLSAKRLSDGVTTLTTARRVVRSAAESVRAIAGLPRYQLPVGRTSHAEARHSPPHSDYTGSTCFFARVQSNLSAPGRYTENSNHDPFWFEFPWMSFGLRNAAQTFQRFMDEVLRGLDWCYVYIDDIFAASSSIEEHKNHLRELFGRLNDYGVLVNCAKCVFGAPEVTFLGHAVNAHGTQPLPQKVEAIRTLPRSATVKELRQFLGMVNFYRRFVSAAAQIQAPLITALQENVKDRTPVEWTSDRIEAFELCKESLARATLLAHPDVTLPLAIFTDASNYTIGAALQQRSGNG
ncbi:uncharacterized protein LOC143187473 [Calliopsis andreniformis]|uniref:uncharacterized protein LOC143187473 n=1 Tax=Calliopsis andreniformis TaxID=337506 RepID=UPI003FCC6D88